MNSMIAGWKVTAFKNKLPLLQHEVRLLLSNTYFEPFQTSMMGNFHYNSSHFLTVNYFHDKAPS